jgi:hypothetical protein
LATRQKNYFSSANILAFLTFIKSWRPIGGLQPAPADEAGNSTGTSQGGGSLRTGQQHDIFRDQRHAQQHHTPGKAAPQDGGG